MCNNEECENNIIFKWGKCEECFYQKRLICLATKKCFFCDCKLRPFRTTQDWRNRIAHKKCKGRNINF